VKRGPGDLAPTTKKWLPSKPTAGSYWTVRSAAQETGLSKNPVARMFALFGIQPHRSKSFQLSTDPLFIDKVRDIVGRYQRKGTRGRGRASSRSPRRTSSDLRRACPMRRVRPSPRITQSRA
jgi:hypothetical protein